MVDRYSYLGALQPCPFCGGEKIQNAAVPDTNGNRRFMRCLGCGAEGPWDKGTLDAPTRWNTRHAGPSDGTSVGPWKECVYKHTDAPVPSIRVDPAYLLKLEAAAERYRWLRERPSFIGWDWWEPPVPRNVLITPEFMDTAIDEKLRLGATTLPLTKEKPCS